MPTSSIRAPARRSVVRIVVAWRAKASCAFWRTRTCSRESFVGRRKSYVRGSPRRLRALVPLPWAAGAGTQAGAAGDATEDWRPAWLGAGPVSGWVTFHLIGGTGPDPDQRRRAVQTSGRGVTGGARCGGA